MSDALPNEYERAKSVTWRQPPQDLLDSVMQMPTDRALAPPPAQASRRAMRPEDIRSSGTAPSVQTHEYDAAAVSLLVTPPEGEGLHTVRGFVWLKEPSDDEFEVAITSGEHVLGVTEARDGQEFELQELLGHAWQLEVHLPQDQVLILEGPTG